VGEGGLSVCCVHNTSAHTDERTRTHRHARAHARKRTCCALVGIMRVGLLGSTMNICELNTGAGGGGGGGGTVY
jgi:hypothetical protein